MTAAGIEYPGSLPGQVDYKATNTENGPTVIDKHILDIQYVTCDIHT